MFYAPIESEIAFFIVVYTKEPIVVVYGVVARREKRFGRFSYR